MHICGDDLHAELIKFIFPLHVFLIKTAKRSRRSVPGIINLSFVCHYLTYAMPENWELFTEMKWRMAIIRNNVEMKTACS